MINKWELRKKQSGYFPYSALLLSELSTEEEDEEDGSSDEFTDSIEEDNDQVMARSSASVAGRDLPQRSEVKELEEAKKILEGKLEETTLPPEGGGNTSAVQMRYKFISAVPNSPAASAATRV